ncbi:MAG TPA: hypothetical protein VGM89_16930 [Puia sp.]
MKAILFFALVFAAFGSSVFAQNTLKVRLVTLDRSVRSGYLYGFTDSAMLLSANSLVRPYAYREMARIELHRKGVVWKSALAGLGIGLATGALLGFISGDDPREQWFALTAEEKAMAGGVLGGTIGTLIGFVVGAASHRSFTIGGDRKRYERMRSKTIARLGL